MFRTTRIDIGKWLQFFKKQKRLILPLTLLLLGFVVGCIVFCRYGRLESAFLGRILSIDPIESGFKGVLSALYNSCFLPTLLLGVLFFCGLSACGIPFMWAVPLFFGLGLGMSESYYYSTGWRGVLLAVVLVLPSALLKGTALLMGCAEGVRMSRLVGSTLMQRNVGEGLYGDFRLFVLRFGIFLLLIFAGGIVDTLLRLWML